MRMPAQKVARDLRARAESGCWPVTLPAPGVSAVPYSRRRKVAGHPNQDGTVTGSAPRIRGRERAGFLLFFFKTEPSPVPLRRDPLRAHPDASRRDAERDWPQKAQKTQEEDGYRGGAEAAEAQCGRRSPNADLVRLALPSFVSFVLFVVKL
jgi:hypothetical protein